MRHSTEWSSINKLGEQDENTFLTGGGTKVPTGTQFVSQ